VEKRETAMLEITEYDVELNIDKAPVSELVHLLLKGFSDPVPLIRLRAAQAAASQANRLVISKELPNVEKALERLFANINSTDDVIKEPSGRTTVQVEALLALQQIKYDRLSGPQYFQWESTILIPMIEGLDKSAEVVNSLGAVRLCVGIECGGNELAAIKVLKRALGSKEEEVRLAALSAVYSFNLKIRLQPSFLLLCISLYPEIQALAEHGESFERKKQARDLVRAVDAKVENYEETTGVHLTPQNVNHGNMLDKKIGESTNE
jgi:HEAT repeat protein